MPKKRKSPKKRSGLSKMDRASGIYRAKPRPYQDPEERLSDAERRLLQAIFGIRRL